VASLPVQNAAIIDRDGRATPGFYRYLSQLASASGATDVSAELNALADRLDALEGGSVVGAGSVDAHTSGGTTTVQLVGDNRTPAPGTFYGNVSTVGWHALAEILQLDASFIVTDSGYALKGVLSSESGLPGSATLNDAYRVKGDLWYWDGTKWVRDGFASGVLEISLATASLVYNRIDGNGDIRIDGNGDLRITN